MNLMNCRGGRRRRLDLNYAKSFASLSFLVTARRAPRKERKGPMGAGFEASEQQGEAYILTGEKTVQLERTENAVLLRVQMSHGALGTGSASQVRLSGFVSGIVVGDLLDLFELLDEAGLSNLHSRLVHSTVKQGYQRQCEDAVKRMDAKHLVGPMVGRGKANEVGIFHVSESSLDVMLAAIAKDDFFVGQIGTIGE